MDWKFWGKIGLEVLGGIAAAATLKVVKDDVSSKAANKYIETHRPNPDVVVVKTCTTQEVKES